MTKRLPLLMLLVAMLGMAVAACDAVDESDIDDIDGDSDVVGVEPASAYVTVDEMLGTQLYFPEEEDADDIETVVIEDVLFDQNGAIQYVVTDTGSFLDQPNRTLAIPREELTMYQFEDAVAVGTTATGAVVSAFADVELGDGIAVSDELADEFTGLLRASTFEAYEVVNPGEANLGSVETLVVDLEDLSIRYAIMDVGGFLGFDENLLAVPFERFAYNADEGRFTLDASAERLEGAPRLNADTWEVDALGWDAEVIAYWGEG